MASTYDRLKTKWNSWHLRRDVAAGRIMRGRQPEAASPGEVKAKAEPKAEIAMRVYRAATDTWENV